MGLLFGGSCLSPRWQRSLLVPWDLGLLCKDVRTSYSSLVSFSVWHLSIIIDGCTSSDRSPGLMFVKVRVWVSSWSFTWVGVMQVHYVVCACVA